MFLKNIKDEARHYINMNEIIEIIKDCDNDVDIKLKDGSIINVKKFALISATNMCFELN